MSQIGSEDAFNVENVPQHGHNGIISTDTTVLTAELAEEQAKKYFEKNAIQVACPWVLAVKMHKQALQWYEEKVQSQAELEQALKRIIQLEHDLQQTTEALERAEKEALETNDKFCKLMEDNKTAKEALRLLHNSSTLALKLEQMTTKLNTALQDAHAQQMARVTEERKNAVSARVIESQRASLDTAEKQIADLWQQTVHLTGELATTVEQNKTHLKEIEALQQVVQYRDEAVAMSKQTFHETVKEMQDKSSVQMGDLRTQMQMMQSGLLSKLDDEKTMCSKLLADIESLKERIAELQMNVVDQQTEVHACHETIAQLRAELATRSALSTTMTQSPVKQSAEETFSQLVVISGETDKLVHKLDSFSPQAAHFTDSTKITSRGPSQALYSLLSASTVPLQLSSTGSTPRSLDNASARSTASNRRLSPFMQYGRSGVPASQTSTKHDEPASVFSTLLTTHASLGQGSLSTQSASPEDKEEENMI